MSKSYLCSIDTQGFEENEELHSHEKIFIGSIAKVLEITYSPDRGKHLRHILSIAAKNVNLEKISFLDPDGSSEKEYLRKQIYSCLDLLKESTVSEIKFDWIISNPAKILPLLAQLPNITKFNFTNCQDIYFREEKTEYIGYYGYGHAKRSLFDAIKLLLSSNKTIDKLLLDYNHLSNKEIIETVDCIKGNEKITSIKLSGNKNDGKSINYLLNNIINGNIPLLKSITLLDTYIDDEDLLSIASFMSKNFPLEKLEITTTSFLNKESIHKFMDSVQCSNLKNLTFGYSSDVSMRTNELQNLRPIFQSNTLGKLVLHNYLLMNDIQLLGIFLEANTSLHTLYISSSDSYDISIDINSDQMLHFFKCINNSCIKKLVLDFHLTGNSTNTFEISTKLQTLKLTKLSDECCATIENILYNSECLEKLCINFRTIINKQSLNDGMCKIAESLRENNSLTTLCIYYSSGVHALNVTDHIEKLFNCLSVNCCLRKLIVQIPRSNDMVMTNNSIDTLSNLFKTNHTLEILDIDSYVTIHSNTFNPETAAKTQIINLLRDNYVIKHINIPYVDIFSRHKRIMNITNRNNLNYQNRLYTVTKAICN